MLRPLTLLGPRVWLLWAGSLLFVTAAVGSAATRAPDASRSSSGPVLVHHKAQPRHRVAVGDRWRVRCSRLPLQQQDPSWSAPETWLFAATGVEHTPDGPRLIVTATRSGESKPTVKLQLDPETRAVLLAETVVPVPGGVRNFVERAQPGEPFVSEVSPVPIALPEPEGKQAPPKTANLSPSGGNGPTLAFSFGRRFNQKTEPVDASVGQAKIQHGMEPLRRRREAGLEPTGIPRYLTVIDGPGYRIEEVWDDTTPWPLYSETQSSRSWLVDYTKGK